MTKMKVEEHGIFKPVAKIEDDNNDIEPLLHYEDYFQVGTHIPCCKASNVQDVN